jgi:hypothetical protein
VKYLIGIGLFAGGVFVGIEFTKWYAKKRVTDEGHAAINKIFGSGYAGQVATQVYDGGISEIFN